VITSLVTGLGELEALLDCMAWPEWWATEDVGVVGRSAQRLFEVKRLDLPAWAARAQAVVTVFDGALRLSVGVPDGESLPVDAGSQWLARWRSFLALNPAETLQVTLRLDKAAWLATVAALADRPGRSILFLRAQAAVQALGGDLDRVETLLWGGDPAARVVLLVGDTDLDVEGPFLTVLGGACLARLADADLSVQGELGAAAERFRSLCRSQGWWCTPGGLTPFHLQATIRAGAGTGLARRLAGLRLTYFLSVAATQRQVVDGHVVCRVAAGGNALDIPLSGADVEPLAGPDPLTWLTAWTFESSLPTERMMVLRLALNEVVPADLAVQGLGAIQARLSAVRRFIEWHWQAIVRDQVDKYADDVRAVEEDVAKAVGAFADQSAAQVKSMSDVVMGAAGVFFGAAVAAMFGDHFKPRVFTLGMYGFAVYVGVLHVLVGTTLNLRRKAAIQGDLLAALDRRSFRLPPETLASIRDAPVRRETRTFWLSFGFGLAVYAALIAMALLAAHELPQVRTAATTAVGVPGGP